MRGKREKDENILYRKQEGYMRVSIARYEDARKSSPTRDRRTYFAEARLAPPFEAAVLL